MTTALKKTQASTASAALHQQIEQLANAQPPAQRAVFLSYAQALFADCAEEDLAGQSAAQQQLRLLGLWAWAQARTAGEGPHLRVYNPPPGGGHWREDATYIELVTTDMPFLVDSIAAELGRLNLEAELALHPVFSVARDDKGTLQNLQTTRAEGLVRESWMHITITRQNSEALEGIRAMLLKVLADVKVAVTDWPDMRRAVREAMAAMPDELPLTVGPETAQEAEHFLDWLDNDHFVFLGYRDYRLSTDGSLLEMQGEASRGLLRDSDLVVLRGIRRFDELPETVQAFLKNNELIFVNKAQARSTVHRRAFYDIIGVKHFNAQGKFAGLRIFLGLFTSMAYSRNAQDVPWLRLKVGRVIDRSGIDPRSHNGKALIHILNTYPRDDLFQIDEDQLYAITRGILMLAERQRTALFIWRDSFNRFFSAIIYTPRDNYDTALRQKFLTILEAGLQAKVSNFTTAFTENPMVRLQVTLDREPGSPAEIADLAQLERQLIDAARGWDDRFADAVMALSGDEAGRRLRERYSTAFPAIYRAAVAPERAASDLELCEAVMGERPIALALHAVAGNAQALQLRLFHRETPLALSDVLPRLENLGLRIVSESSYQLTPKNCLPVWISELSAESRDGQAVQLEQVRAPFTEAFYRLWAGELEDDRFNALVLRLGLSWREVSVLRAYAKYLQQARFTPTPSFIRDTMAAHADTAKLFIELFHAKFDPAHHNTDKAAALVAQVEAALEKVTSLAEDEVLRRYLNLLQVSLRTNYYLEKPYISIKLDSQKVTDLPLPRPYAEIYVYSPRVEGIHLRGGRVARGGIRWSDRRDDYRTEVLGLMKAQQVKNAVIVPVGSKGGFYCKHLPTDKVAEGKEVIACYQTFIRGLLDITDNRVGDGVMTPKNVVRHDGDDPYLVVAADKGTAKFSDIANALSLEYGFWLGDAFASGGSAGYDHKHMGITARGAWEAVKRHFRELDKDIQQEEFTCVGVGDMAGDVFGNGMLLSPHTLLVAAFNHRHIFLDPNPDAATSFAERKRLFEQAGSQWSDYTGFSKGGGVFERSAKSIPLSPEVQARFGLAVDKMAPNELIQLLLKADVDLLYLGGIGTYIKASSESHAEVSDKANDALRVDAQTLRAKVVGEGANLGFTAKARIEYARAGGRINSDAIDNSAGVDTSDHEVNIKIALQPEMARLVLTKADRDKLLVSMTDDVAGLVLRDNYLQTQLLSQEQAMGPRLLDAHARLMQQLEKAGKLDRAVEFLPADDVLAQRTAAGEGLTRSELGLLLAYSKMAVHDEILASQLPDDPAAATALPAYFPPAMQQRFAGAITAHRLKREIIATVLANDVVNRMGISFVQQLAERSGHAPAAVVRAYLLVREAMKLPTLWAQIEALDNKVPAAVQIDLLQAIAVFGARASSTTLYLSGDSQNLIAALGKLWAELAAGFDSIISPSQLAQVQAQAGLWTAAGVPGALARAVAQLSAFASGPRIVKVADQTKLEFAAVAVVFYRVGEQIECDKLRSIALHYRAANYWQRQQAMSLMDEIGRLQQHLTQAVLAHGGDVSAWAAGQQDALVRTRQFIGELTAGGQPDLAMLTMAIRALRTLAN
jgi:glutamate dehydrogenase